MGDIVPNIAKGAVAEKIRNDDDAIVILLLLATSEADATLLDYDTVAAILAGSNTEVTDGSSSRKAAGSITATVTVDDTNNRVDVDMRDQTFTALDGAAIDRLVVAQEESASDAGRVPLAILDFDIDPSGNDVIAQFNSAGFFRAS